MRMSEIIKHNILAVFVMLILVCSIGGSHAQERQVKLKNNQGHASSQLNQYIQKSKKYLAKNNLDSADYFIDKAGAVLGNQKWPKAYTDQLFEVTKALFKGSYFEKSVSKSNLFIDQLNKYNKEDYYIKALEINASSLMFQGEFEQAEAGFTKYIEFVDKLNEKTYSKDELIDFRTSYFFNQGISQAIQGQHSEALLWFNKADSILQLGGSSSNQLTCLTYMGNINNELKQFELALTYFKKVEDAYLAGSDVGMIQVYDNMSISYRKLGRFKEAQNSLKKGLVLARELGDSLSVGYNFLNQARIFEEQGLFSAAIEKTEEALARFEFVNNPRMINDARLRLVAIANDAGLTQTKHLNTIEEALAFYEASQIKEYLIWAYELKANVLYNLGEYKQAAEVFRFHDSINKNWLLEKYNEKTAALESNYRANYYKIESENKAQYAEILEYKNERKNSLLYLFSTLLGVFILLVVLFWNFNQKLKASREKISEQNATLEKRNREKTLLLKELHHRVKNNLQIVSSLLNLQSIAAKDQSAQNAFKDGQNRVDAMAMIHRYLYTSDELTHVDIQSYLSRLVESIAYSYNFNKKNIVCQYDISAEPIDVDIAIPLGLIANELLSNAFKHAFKNNDNPELHVVLNFEDALIFEVKDNGQGVPESTNNADSFGMELVQSLVVQLNASLDYSYQHGACFRLSIPRSSFAQSKV